MADSALSRTLGSPTNADKWTWSAWLKRAKLSTSGVYMDVFAAYTDGNNYAQLSFHPDNYFFYYDYQGGAVKASLSTVRKFRDGGGWYHFVVATDTTQATAANRVKLYINGEQYTWDNATTYPTQNQDTMINKASTPHYIGQVGVGNFFEGFMSHVAFVDGQQLAPTVFGQTDSTTGTWTFKSPSPTWGTNGAHIKFENSGNLGLDSSTNTNNWTVAGTLKQSIDTPSIVYPIMNPAFNLSDIQNTEAGMRMKNTNSNWKYINSTLAANKGKWYCEHKINTNGGYIMVGVTDMEYATSQDKSSYTHCGAGTGGVGLYSADGNKYIQASATTYAASVSTNDVVGCALDMDNDKVYFSKNGAWANGSGGWGSTTFDAAVGAISLPTTNGTYAFATSVRSSAITQTNFGTGQFGATTISSAGSNGNGSLFEYDVPSGYYALNTKNLNTYG